MAKLTREQRREMAALVLTGARNHEIAEKTGVRPETVSRLRSRLKSSAPAEFDYRTAREQLRQAAYPAIQAGLEDNSDNHKRASIGVQVLRGTGDLAVETNVQISLQTALASVPVEWHSRYILNEPEEPTALSETVTKET